MGAAEGIGVDERGFGGPRHAIARAKEHELAVGIDVVVAGFAKNFAVGGATERKQEFSVRTADDRRDRGVEARVFVDDDVFDFLGRGGGRGGAEKRGADERESEDRRD